MKNQLSLTSGSVNSTLLKFALPIMLTLCVQSTYSAVDLLIVGQFSEVAELTGVTVGSQAMQILLALCTGFAMGSTVLIGRRTGENNPTEVQRVMANTVIAFSTFAALSMAIMLIFNGQIVSLLDTPTASVSQTSSYLFFCTLGIPMIFAYNILGSIFRGLGDSKTPLVAVLVACVCNIALDLILVAGFNMGAAGAAIATSISQGVSVVVSLVIAKKKGFKVGKLKADFKIIGNIFKIGAPIALQSVLTSFSFLALTVIVNQYDSVVYSASVGVCEKLSGIIMLVPLAFMQALSAYVAQNMGADKPQRAHKALYIALIYSCVFGFIMAFFAFFKGEVLIKLFTSDLEVRAAAVDYLKAYAFDTALVPPLFCLIGFFNGLGKTTFVMIQGVVGAVLLRIPLAYIFSLAFPMSLFHIGLGTPISTSLQVVACIVFYIFVHKKEKKTTLNLTA